MSKPAYMESSETPLTEQEWEWIVQRNQEQRNSLYDVDVLMGEVVRLRAEVARLEAALQDIEQCGTYDGHSELCETEWESVPEARYAEASEEEIEADLRKNCCCPAKQSYLAEKALQAKTAASQ